MKTVLQIVLLTLAVAGVAAAAETCAPGVPEIGVGGAASAVGILAGGLLLMRSRRRKRMETPADKGSI